MKNNYLHGLSELARQLEEADRKPPKPGRSRAKRRAIERKRLLDEKVPDRICPQCGNQVLKPRSWVLFDDDHKQLKAKSRQVGAICRSCACSWLWLREGGNE